jgi:hypothetical protein
MVLMLLGRLMIERRARMILALNEVGERGWKECLSLFIVRDD